MSRITKFTPLGYCGRHSRKVGCAHCWWDDFCDLWLFIFRQKFIDPSGGLDFPFDIGYVYPSDPGFEWGPVTWKDIF